MRIVIFCHSVLSDWHNGSAHFLRGLATELLSLGHDVEVFEPVDAWSVQNLVADHGEASFDLVRAAYPSLRVTRFVESTLDIDATLGDASVIFVHEWTSLELVRRIGDFRRTHPHTRLLFHDTHHRAFGLDGALDLTGYDAILAFGKSLRDAYATRPGTPPAFVFHEAADPRVFRPLPGRNTQWDVVWIGNYGDGERTLELEEFLLDPIADLGLRAIAFGVRYPPPARSALARAGIEYGGYLPNTEAPEAFARARLTIHVPGRAYTKALPGIPTIRPFEALACGVPLVSAPWLTGQNFVPRASHTAKRPPRCVTQEDYAPPSGQRGDAVAAEIVAQVLVRDQQPDRSTTSQLPASARLESHVTSVHVMLDESPSHTGQWVWATERSSNSWDRMRVSVWQPSPSPSRPVGAITSGASV